MRKLRPLAILLCLIVMLSSCSSTHRTALPDDIMMLVKDITHSVNAGNTEEFMGCMDSTNPNFYAEQYHMFQDLKTLEIKDFKLEISGFAKEGDGCFNITLNQSWSLYNDRHTIEYCAVFKKVDGAYKYSDIKFNSMHTDHFVIKHSPSLLKQAEDIRLPAEKAYDNVRNIYGRIPSDKTVIKLYDNNEVFSWFIKPSINFKMAGWYEYPESIKINMSPEIVLRYGSSEFIERYVSVLSHELTHRVSIEESGNNMPYWMAEGLATYVENGGDLRLSKPGRNIEELEKINLEKLTDSREISQYYQDSYINISLFIDKFGKDRLHDIIYELGKYPVQQKTGGRSIDENNDKFHRVLKSLMSMTVEQLDNILSSR